MTALSSAPCNVRQKRAALLLAWYGSVARGLPWRGRSDPYAVWVSEVMLQQTQVKTVLPRYASWLNRFPDIASLAAADPDAVLKSWEGLGYYRRAQRLHATAKTIMASHGGRFPRRFEDILSLPGIGRSTAGAIASICFGTHTPVLDGNVRRVLVRWNGLHNLGEAELWALASEEIREQDDPGEWNQAMMELGACVCIPHNPACHTCPVAASCRGAHQALPVHSMRRTTVRDMHWRVHLYLSQAGIWLCRRPQGGIWAGLWSPPVTELSKRPGASPCHVHLLTHRRLHLYGTFAHSLPEGDGRWVGNSDEVALPVGIRRLLEKHGL
jgi:A/G-specific adenine glycosylase